MGRAIVRKPQVFLFDEPLSNLDAKLRVQMRVEIKRLQRALGVTAIYVTHDQVEAMTLSDKLVVMNAGQIEQVGTPSEVYRRPQTRYVATFIGSPPMNILPGTVEGPGRVSVGGQSLAAADMGANIPAGTAIDVGLRPEDMRAGTEGTGMLTADIDFVEELGATQLFHGKLAGAEFVVQAPTGQIPAESKRLSLSIDPVNVHLFDPQSQRRVGR
jgi:sn-glycerol 3-phosphate transport system ATP-binding protein